MANKIFYNRSEAGNAQYLRDFAKGNLIFNYRTQSWYEWTGFKWQLCANGQQYEWAKRAIKRMITEALDIEDDDKRKQAIRWAIASESNSKINGTLNLARSLKGVADSGEGWDTNPHLIGCPRGILDLKTGNFLKPNKKIKVMSSLALDPDDKAKCPQFEQFLKEVYEGDIEMISFIKRLLGYSLTGSVEEQCVFCFYGHGANGKSTLTDTILSLFGTYGYPMPFSTIEFNTRSAISNDMAHLYGKRFVVASETQDGVRLNEGRLKALTGGDVVTARFMYKEYFSFKPTAHFILSFNHKPIITDDSEGAWRRIHLIPHNRFFKPNERDKKLGKKLYAELPGILNWMIEGCLEWQKLGLMPPKSVIQGTHEYRQEMNPLREFIDDDCVTGGFCVRVTELWEAYNHWADSRRERFRLTHRSFNTRLETMGFKRQTMRINGGSPEKCWIGVSLVCGPTAIKGAEEYAVN